MATETKYDYWQLAAEALCEVHVNLQPKPEPCNVTKTKFMIDFQAVIRRVTSSDAERLNNRDVDNFISRTSITNASIELEPSNERSVGAVSGVLRELKVPLSERDRMVSKVIMCEVREVEKDMIRASWGRRYSARLVVNIDLIVVVDDDDDEDEEEGIELRCLEGGHPYVDSFMIEELKKTGVCPKCVDEGEALWKKLMGEEDLIF